MGMTSTMNSGNEDYSVAESGLGEVYVVYGLNIVGHEKCQGSDENLQTNIHLSQTYYILH